MPRTTVGRLEKKGKIYMAYWAKDHKRFARSTKTGNLRKAQKLLEVWVNDAKADTVLERGRRTLSRMLDDLPPVKLVDLYAKYKDAETKRRSERAMSRTECIVERFVKWSKEHYPDADDLTKVTKAIASEFVAGILEHESARTAREYRTSLHHVWDVVLATGGGKLEAGLVMFSRGGNPWKGVQSPGEADAEAKAVSRRDLTRDELAKVLETAMADGPETGLLFLLGAHTGLRLKDCCLMGWDSVNLDRRLISATPAKTMHSSGIRVYLPITDTLRKALEVVPEDVRHGYIVPGIAALYKKGSGYLVPVVQRVFTAAGIDTRVKRDGRRAAAVVGFHSLRHTFATLAVEYGIPMEALRQSLGHVRTSMTETYVHQTLETVARVGQQMEGALSGRQVKVDDDVADLKARIMTLAPEKIAELRRLLGW